MEHNSIQNYTDYKAWLQTELVKRCEANPRYSLRAFATSLKLSPSFLSKILSGKRPLTFKTANHVAQVLALSPAEKTKLMNLIIENGHSKESPSHTQKTEKYTQLTMEAFSVISDWYHYAITELIYLKDFKNDPRWIAKKIGISIMEAKMAVQRLKHLEILEEKNGKLVKTQESLTTTTDFASSALKKFHKQVLEKAAYSLQEDDVSERDFSAISMAIDENKIPQAKKMIKKFRRSLCKFLTQDKRTRIYNLSVQLYPLSKKNSGRKKT
ncbi:MAG TPA: TIGR02147 family protein [Bdellovibrionota bacterium]|nr:TIGR02147 family protein [Bdellovibrionota bacterium]